MLDRFLKFMTPAHWQKLLGAIGVGVALILAQSDVVLDPVLKLALVVTAGVVAYLRPGQDSRG